MFMCTNLDGAIPHTSRTVYCLMPPLIVLPSSASSIILFITKKTILGCFDPINIGLHDKQITSSRSDLTMHRTQKTKQWFCFADVSVSSL